MVARVQEVTRIPDLQDEYKVINRNVSRIVVVLSLLATPSAAFASAPLPPELYYPTYFLGILLGSLLAPFVLFGSILERILFALTGTPWPPV